MEILIYELGTGQLSFYCPVEVVTTILRTLRVLIRFFIFMLRNKIRNDELQIIIMVPIVQRTNHRSICPQLSNFYLRDGAR